MCRDSRKVIAMVISSYLGVTFHTYRRCFHVNLWLNWQGLSWRQSIRFGFVEERQLINVSSKMSSFSACSMRQASAAFILLPLSCPTFFSSSLNKVTNRKPYTFVCCQPATEESEINWWGYIRDVTIKEIYIQIRPYINIKVISILLNVNKRSNKISNWRLSSSSYLGTFFSSHPQTASAVCVLSCVLDGWSSHLWT